MAISNKGISGTSRNGYLIQRDPAHPNSYGSGVILVQNSLNFNLACPRWELCVRLFRRRPRI